MHTAPGGWPDPEKLLPPTTELRQFQYREDDHRGVGKRNRVALGSDHVERYPRGSRQVRDRALVPDLPMYTTTALVCVERDPEAYRSLVATRLRDDFGLPVADLSRTWGRGQCGSN